MKVSVKRIKKVLQELKSVRKSPPAENPHHVETSQSTHKISKLTVCHKDHGQKPEETSKQTRVS